MKLEPSWGSGTLGAMQGRVSHVSNSSGPSSSHSPVNLPDPPSLLGSNQSWEGFLIHRDDPTSLLPAKVTAEVENTSLHVPSLSDADVYMSAGPPLPHFHLAKGAILWP